MYTKIHLCQVASGSLTKLDGQILKQNQGKTEKRARFVKGEDERM
jgi:hypothetical protein